MSSQPTNNVAASGDTPAVQGAPNVTGQPTANPEGDFTAATTISSMNDLRQKAPKIYNAMLQGLATNMVNEMKDHQARIKEMNRKAREDADGRS